MIGRNGLPKLPSGPPLNAPLTPPQQLFRRGPALAPAPQWVGPFYLLLGVLLVPWTVYLGVTLPEHSRAAHYALAWTGLDVMEVAALVSTAYLAYRRSTWVEMAATVTGVLLVVDAWFDVTTSRSGPHFLQAILSAAILEIPLAVVSFYIARNAQVVNEAITRWLIARSVAQSEGLAASERQAAAEHLASSEGVVAGQQLAAAEGLSPTERRAASGSEPTDRC